MRTQDRIVLSYNFNVFAASLILLSLLFSFQTAHQPRTAEQEGESQEDESGFRIDVAVNQVFLSVNARSVGGGFVEGLRKEDFRVFEDGRLQKIVNFYSQEVPVKVVLVIDASGSTRHNQTDIRRAALEFVETLDPEDEVAVITFNHQPRLVQEWTSDIEEVENALLSTYPRGYTVLNDALYVTFDDLLGGVDGKTAVVLLTDGIDTGSMVGFDEAVDLALHSESMVYVISKLEEYWAGAIGARQQLRAQSRIIPKQLTDEYILQMKRSLQRLAQLTGGKVLEASGFVDLTQAYQQVAEELKNQYYLSYTPTNQAKDGKWRSLDVQIMKGGVVASARRGYYADGPNLSSP